MKAGIGLTITAVVLLVIAGTPRAAAPRASDRLLVVISDLHLGVGRQGQEWHPAEDFRWLPAFRNFLNEVDRQGGGRADLVIAGDALELWQSLVSDCRDRANGLGCTEVEVLRRVRRVINAHGDELRALGAFAARGDNRVVLVPGNHDAGLLFPSVAAAVVAATGSVRVRVETNGYWRSADGQILVEHGQQIGHEVNKFANWPRPFVGTSPQYLERTWGEQFVQEFYNAYEDRYPIIDNVTEEGAGIWYAKEVEGWPGLTAAFGRFLYFYATKLSPRQVGASLGQGDGGWDLDATRRSGLRLAIEALPDGNAFKTLLSTTPEALNLSALDDQELAEICDGLASALPADTKPCVTSGTLGAATQALSRRSKASIVGQYLVDRQAELARSTAATQPFRLYIYAHTHLADRFQPLAASRPDWDPTVINSGAWQRTVTPDQLETLRCKVPAGGSPVSLKPDDLPACYSSVWVSPYSNVPAGTLRFWVEDQSTGHLAASCQWSSPCQ